MKKCPDCKGNGGNNAIDISDYVPCPTCEETGKVEEGTKGWLENLLTHKEEAK